MSKPEYPRADRRHYKRICNHRFKKLKRGSYFIDCNNHVCLVTEKGMYSPFDAFVDGVSQFDGNGTSCSIYYCAPTSISDKEAKERIAFAKSHSWEDYMRKYDGCTEEDLEYYRQLDAVWNFRKPVHEG